MQFLYWEKVQPRRDGQSFLTPYMGLIPLMKNWNLVSVKYREEYDGEHGRGHGKVTPLGLVRISFLCVPFLMFEI